MQAEQEKPEQQQQRLVAAAQGLQVVMQQRVESLVREETVSSVILQILYALELVHSHCSGTQGHH